MTKLNVLTAPEAAVHSRAAVLDAAHDGDITGAWGTIKQHDTARRSSWLRRLLTLLAIMGPGLIVMVADNDAGGIATYTQAGQNYGTSLLWTLFLLIPVLIVNQEMVVRLGAVTGVGHARLIFARFGRFWGAFSLGDLLILNFLTVVTEFIGISQGFRYFGISPYLSVPVAGIALIVVTATGSFRKWERLMYITIIVSLLMFPLALLAHPSGGRVLHDAFVPGVKGGLNSTALLVIVAIVGTTVAPWQLFFQQSNVIDKRITSRWLTYERWDTILGALLTNFGAAALMIAAAFAFAGTAYFNSFKDAGNSADAFLQTLGNGAGAIFAIVLIDAAIIGGIAVTLSASYAVGDVFGARHSLHRSWKDARIFYGSYALLVVLAGAIVVIPNAPLGLLTQAVQALAGVLLPSATVFLLLLCNDKDVLGPWVNPRWLNSVATLIVGVLVLLSLVLVVATLLPQWDAILVTEILGAVLAISFLTIEVVGRLRSRHDLPAPIVERASWQMPPLNALPKPSLSKTRLIGMYTLRGYLLVAVILLGVKVVQLATGSG